MSATRRELWDAAQGAEASWAYLGYGPFADEAAMRRHVAAFAATHDPMAWAVRPVATGVVSGWLTLMEIQPANAAIELGHIWFAPRMQRTRAATEAMFLLLRLAADELGYRRLVWKCNALNAPSRRAAERLGFTYEGTLRATYVVKGRRRDTACFSILADEWPRCRDALAAWLDPANFAPDGTALHGLASCARDGVVRQGALDHLLGEYGYGVVFVIIMLEAMGVPLPGESLIIAASVYAATTGRLSIVGVIVAAIVRRDHGGQFRLPDRPLGRLSAAAAVWQACRADGQAADLGRYLFKTQGGKVVFVGRFIAILRTFVALLAGANRMDWKRFLLWNAVGGVALGDAYGVRRVSARQPDAPDRRPDRHRARRGGRDRHRGRHRPAPPQRGAAGRQGGAGDGEAATGRRPDQAGRNCRTTSSGGSTDAPSTYRQSTMPPRSSCLVSRPT